MDAGRALSDDEALDQADASIAPRGAIPRPELHELLEALADYGLLLRTRVPSPGLDADSYEWQPAFETLSDYLLAVEAQSDILASPPPAKAPEYLQTRRDALALAITISGTKGFCALSVGLWEDDVGDAKDLLQLRALLASPPDEAVAHSDWVKTQLTHSMPSCRLTLAALVIPGLRLPGFRFGAAFVQETLRGLGVAARDLFWSGPSFLPHNHGAVWEGHGNIAIDNLQLADDDPWDTAPLLMAWTLTTVEQKLRRTRRRQLANWGALQLEPLKNLVAEASDTNDPQMLEDLLRAAQAACYLADDLGDGAGALGGWVLKELPSRINACSPDNIVCLHAARAIVETLRSRGVELDEPGVAYSGREYLELDVSILPRDRLVDSGTDIISMDLAHYAVPNAYRPFFSNRPPQSAGNPEEPDETLASMKSELLEALASKKIRAGAEAAARDAAKQELVRRTEVSSQADEERRKRDAEVQALLDELNQLPEEERQRLLESWRTDLEKPTELYPSPAAELLERHAKKNSLATLRASEFAFAHISWRATQLGWKRNTHYGHPNGGKPGEILGADIAILRRHHPAKTGRSDVSMFNEKYVWLGVHELVGFLSAHLPVESWDLVTAPPADPSLFVEEPSPATDELSPVSTSGVKGEPFAVLVPDVELNSNLQHEKANEWIEAAPPTGVPACFLVQPHGQEDDWVVLRGWRICTNEDSLAQSILWTSAAEVSLDDIELIREDSRAGLFMHKREEWSAGIRKVEFYTDPTEAVWAPWLQEDYASMSHLTFDSAGHPKSVQLRTTSCGFHWQSEEGEQEIQMPAQWLRRALGLWGLKEGRFLDKEGQVSCIFDTSDGNLLLARKSAIDAVLKERNSTLLWFTRVYREPSTSLLQPEWPCNRSDHYSVEVLCGGKIVQDAEKFTADTVRRRTAAKKN